MPGLFSIFNTAKSGLFSQQTAINVTSHNIANANTDGYSRQRADMVTTTPYTMPSMDSSAGAGQLGTGVTIESIERIRDSFLDYQYRTQNGINGQYTARDKMLSQVESMLNEPTDTGMSTLLSKFFTSWQSLSTSSQNSSAVAQQAYQLTGYLNTTYAQISNVKVDTNTNIKTDVITVNGYLSQISSLNQQIQSVKIAGQNPNDLMDSRDLLLDKLSNEFGINITDTDNDGINLTTSNASLIAGTDDNGNAPTLGGTQLNIVQAKNPDNTATFSYVNSIAKATDASGNYITVGTSTPPVYEYNVTYYKKGDSSKQAKLTVDMTEAQAKELDENRVLWADNDGNAYKADETASNPQNVTGAITDGTKVNFSDLALFKPPSGELKGYASVESDIDKYQDRLNSFAKSLAMSVNSVISQSSIWVPDDPQEWMAANSSTEYSSAEGGINNFFVNGDQKDSLKYSASDEDSITAGNITLNVAILNDASKIKVSSKYDSNGNESGTTDGKRATAVAQIANATMNIGNISASSTRSDLVGDSFTTNSDLNNIYSIGNTNGGATLDNYYDDVVSTVGSDEQASKDKVTYEATQLSNFNESRASVSGVSIDEEMTNIIQFQHCYQANAKMISTIDDLLDVVINGLKK